VQILQALPTIVARIASDGASLNAKCSFLIRRHLSLAGESALTNVRMFDVGIRRSGPSGAEGEILFPASLSASQ